MRTLKPLVFWFIYICSRQGASSKRLSTLSPSHNLSSLFLHCFLSCRSAVLLSFPLGPPPLHSIREEKKRRPNAVRELSYEKNVQSMFLFVLCGTHTLAADGCGPSVSRLWCMQEDLLPFWFFFFWLISILLCWRVYTSMFDWWKMRRKLERKHEILAIKVAKFLLWDGLCIVLCIYMTKNWDNLKK